jgi:hypothetical protein
VTTGERNSIINTTTPLARRIGLRPELVRRKILQRLECPPALVSYNLGIHCVRNGRDAFDYGHELLADILGYRRTADAKRKAIQRLIKDWLDYQRGSGYFLQDITRGGCKAKQLTHYGLDHIQPVVDWLGQRVTADPAYGSELPEVLVDRYVEQAISRLPTTPRSLTLPKKKQRVLTLVGGERTSISRDNLAPFAPPSDMCLTALDHHRKGFKVFPANSVKDGICSCKQGAQCDKKGKHPRIVGWQNFAETASDNLIRKLWGRYPNANIGIKTGGSLAVVDVDPRNGGDVEWISLIERNGIDVPETFRVRTGSGGFHLYFTTPEPLRSGQLAPGIDFKAHGGFVIAPGSTHANGNSYQIEVAAPLAAIPEKMLQLAQATRHQTRIPEGDRHNFLRGCARAMAGERRLSCDEIEAELHERRKLCAVGGRAIPDSELHDMACWAVKDEDRKQAIAMKAAA